MKNRGGVLRVVDANLNRVFEGLRVLEEIARFVFDDKLKTSKLKRLRHGIRKEMIFLFKDNAELLKARNSAKDVGKARFSEDEFKRRHLKDVFEANFKRVEEALRVLEEFTKLFNGSSAAVFKKFRFQAYNIEKEFILDFPKSF